MTRPQSIVNHNRALLRAAYMLWRVLAAPYRIGAPVVMGTCFMAFDREK
jgi:hypothetical protein